MISKIRQYDKYALFIVFYCVLFFIVYTSFAYLQHINLKTNLFDLGLQEHVILMTSQSKFFQSGVETWNYLGDHFSLIILPVALIYRLLPHTLTILAIQTLGVTLSILAIYKLACIHIKSKTLSVLVALIFSWYWGISGLLLFDFHVEALALPLLAWGIYYLEKNRLLISILLLFVAMLCKEDVGIFVGMLGIYLLLKKKLLPGIFLFIVGFCFSYFVIFEIMPSIRGGGLDTMLRYSYLGNSPIEIIKTIFTKPSVLINHLLQMHKFKYLLKLFVPVGGIFILSPFASMLFVPSLLINLLADYPQQNSALFQYDIMITIGIFFGFIKGLSKIEKAKISFISRENLLKFVAVILIIFNILFIIRHPLFGKIRNFENRSNDYKSVLNARKFVPANAIVATSNTLGPHFIENDDLLLFDPAWIVYKKVPEYIIIDEKYCCSIPNRQLLETKKKDGSISEIFREKNITVYKTTDEY